MSQKKPKLYMKGTTWFILSNNGFKFHNTDLRIARAAERRGILPGAARGRVIFQGCYFHSNRSNFHGSMFELIFTMPFKSILRYQICPQMFFRYNLSKKKLKAKFEHL